MQRPRAGRDTRPRRAVHLVQVGPLTEEGHAVSRKDDAAVRRRRRQRRPVVADAVDAV